MQTHDNDGTVYPSSELLNDLAARLNALGLLAELVEEHERGNGSVKGLSGAVRAFRCDFERVEEIVHIQACALENFIVEKPDMDALDEIYAEVTEQLPR